MTTLETDRLILRRQRVDDAGIYRQLWMQRDRRVPAHRRIDAAGRPTTHDIAAGIRSGQRPGLLAVERKDEGDVIGYCGLVFDGNGSADEPELAFEFLRRAHGFGYATEASRAVIAWASEAGHKRLWASVRAWNLACRRVLEKLDFHETGDVEVDAAHGDSLFTVLRIVGPHDG